MVVLIFLSLLGFLVSFTSHILLLFKISLPLRYVSTALNFGLVIIIFIRLFFTKNLRQGNNWFLDSSIKDICPYWLKVWTNIIFTYGIVIAAVNLFTMFSNLSLSATMTEADYIIASRQLFLGVFSSLLACFIFEFRINVSFRILKKNKISGKLKGLDMLCRKAL